MWVVICPCMQLWVAMLILWHMVLFVWVCLAIEQHNLGHAVMPLVDNPIQALTKTLSWSLWIIRLSRLSVLTADLFGIETVGLSNNLPLSKSLMIGSSIQEGKSAAPTNRRVSRASLRAEVAAVGRDELLVVQQSRLDFEHFCLPIRIWNDTMFAYLKGSWNMLKPSSSKGIVYPAVQDISKIRVGSGVIMFWNWNILIWWMYEAYMSHNNVMCI